MTPFRLNTWSPDLQKEQEDDMFERKWFGQIECGVDYSSCHESVKSLSIFVVQWYSLQWMLRGWGLGLIYNNI